MSRKPVELLTAPAIIDRMETMEFDELSALLRVTSETRGDEEFIVRASEWFAKPVAKTAAKRKRHL
jgi:hypothetical protein